MEDLSVSAAAERLDGGAARRLALARTVGAAILILTLLIGTGRGDPRAEGPIPVRAARAVGGPQTAASRTQGQQASLTVDEAIKRLTDPNPKMK
jgi:hypothetical protein